MELYEEVERKEKSKAPMIIGICIGILVVMIIAIICAIVYLRSTVLTIKLNNQTNHDLEEILYITGDEGNQQIYVPIRRIAKFLNYEDYRGDYISKSEDSTKCYVKNANEIAMFTKDSTDLVKTNGDSNYEYLTLKEKVFEKDGELYTTPEGIEQAFNVLFENNLQQNKINIYTMDYLNQIYCTALGITGKDDDEIKTSEIYSDQKAILQDMIIIIKDEQYGVITASTGQPVLETKYEEIKYLPSTSDFLIKSNGKYGILGTDTSTKLRVMYDDIKIIDSKNGLYLLKKNNLYGVADKKGKVIIDPSYPQIGVDNTKYKQSGIENQYVLLDEIIPIKNSDGLWAIFNIKGEKIKDFEFTEIGCNNVKESDTLPAVVIPSYKIVIVGKDEHYNLMTSSGEVLIPSYILNSVYIKLNTETGENKFYMSYNNNEKVINVVDWLASIGR